MVKKKRPSVFETTFRKTRAWWREIVDGQQDTDRDLTVRRLQNRLSRQFALPLEQRLRDEFNYHWWRPVTAPGKIKPGLVIPWRRAEIFDYRQQRDALNQSCDASARRESAWQRRKAGAHRLSLAFARAPRLKMPTRFIPSAARGATLKQISPSHAGRRRALSPPSRQQIGRN